MVELFPVITNQPGGTYFLYAFVDINSSGIVDTGDYVGIHDGNLAELPSTPTAVVPSSGTVPFNLTFEMHP